MGLFIISIAKRLDGALDVGAPTIQRLFAFSEEFVPLVDGSYTGNRPFLVVEILSATCGGTPRRAMPETTVRLRSCSRHPVMPDSSSSARFDFELRARPFGAPPDGVGRHPRSR